MSQTSEELNDVLSALDETSYNSILKIIDHLLGIYGPQVEEREFLVNQILISLTSITGEMLAEISPELRDEVEQNCKEMISHKRREAEGQRDLSQMDPKGSC